MERFLARVKQEALSDPKRIVFPESDEERILRAVQIIKFEGFAKPILIGNKDKIMEKICKLELNADGIEFADPDNFDRYDEYVQEFVKVRSHKGMTEEQAREQLKDVNYFGTMMVHMGDADGLISGSTHSTGDTVRPALQIIKTKDKFHKVSSMFLMIAPDDSILIFADCAIEIDPNPQELAEIALDTAETAKRFGIEPRIAMLSFSTNGSAKHTAVDKVKEATNIVKQKDPNLVVEGEIQLDAALIPEICQRKFPDSKLKGDANVLIFPDLNSGNIGYKLVERLAKNKAVGPILQGMNKPINDLSRGCSVQDIVDVCAITVVEAQGDE